MNSKILKKYESVLLGKRFSIDEKQLFLVGIISEFILSKEYFKSNSLIKEYAQFYFDYVDEPLKDYLLASRTLLVARIGKIVLGTDEFEDIAKFITHHMTYVQEHSGSSHNEIRLLNNNKSSILNSLLKEMKNINEID